MEIRLVEKADNAIEVEFVGENETLLNLLKQKLLAMDKVESATYLTGHPLLDQPRLYVEVKSGKPEQVLKQAAKELREQYDEFETQLLRALPASGPA
ncbi:MAG TPA: RpoL/Rpb11 RNA polymerase subunit family protein [Candidatus Thermoplasmatota archaeon]|nr:RpoL/Rpb11 RNA polymerase subunit family protein [Candidatus Thermoplasmatota archaeon]